MARALPLTQLSAILLLVCFAGLALSDFAQDKAECADKLVSLATCLPYLQEKAKSPTPDCCSGLKQLVDKSKRCLCILVKDRNEPQLGYKFNATLALGLPKACSASVNATECIDLLHLSPNATEAQIFKQIADGGPGSNDTGIASSTHRGAPSDGGQGKKLILTRMVFGISLWCLVSIMLLCG